MRRMRFSGAFALAGASCILSFQSASAARVPEVSVLKAEPAPIFDSLVYPARVEARVSAQVLADSEGVVKSVLAPLGRVVTSNQAILVIQNTDPVYEYAPVRVTTPVAGAVTQMDVSIGSRVVRGQKLALVTDPRQTRLVVEVAASDLRSIAKGLEGEFVPAGATADQAVAVRVRGVSPVVDPSTGTAPAELEAVAPKASRLVPGMIGKVVFKANLRQGFQVPEDALIYKDKDPYLRLVVSEGPSAQGVAAATKAKRVAVSLGRASRGKVEVLTGLKPGDVVIARASSYVADGETVQVSKESKEAK